MICKARIRNSEFGFRIGEPPIRNPQSAIRNRSAFTLLEILLVVLVIGIIAGAFLPVAMDSVEGVRLRAATRDVISLNRYARARAILDQRPVAVLYDRGRGLMELLQLPPQDIPLGMMLDTPAARLLEDPDLSTEGIQSLRRRQLASFVTVREVNGAERQDDTWFVIYTPAGMTDPHSIVLEDNRGDRMRINVNGMTGDITLGGAR